jgi:predicted transcriptional regulator
MSTPARFLTVTASTKRRPAVSSGKTGAATTYLASLMVAPLAPIDADLRQRLALETPHELQQSICDGTKDVKEGDVLVVSTVEYPIKACEDWGPIRGRSFKRLVLEDLKN